MKNYIHNELKLTKEDIKEIMIPIVKEEVKRIFQNTYGNDDVQTSRLRNAGRETRTVKHIGNE